MSEREATYLLDFIYQLIVFAQEQMPKVGEDQFLKGYHWGFLKACEMLAERIVEMRAQEDEV